MQLPRINVAKNVLVIYLNLLLLKKIGNKVLPQAKSSAKTKAAQNQPR